MPPKKWLHCVVLINKNDNVYRVDNIPISYIPWREYIHTLGSLGWEFVQKEPFGNEGESRAYFKCPAEQN